MPPNDNLQQEFLDAVRDARTAAGVRERGFRAKRWLKRNVRELYTQYQPDSRADILGVQDTQPRNGRMFIGKMYMFFYSPKGRQKLPYFDRFPLVFILEMYNDGFLALNMHYLPVSLRIQLFDKLIRVASDRRFDEFTRLRISYQIIAGFRKYRLAQPCIKRYLTKHVRSRLKVVNSFDWLTALYLPVESFEKAGKATVWADSRRKVP